MVYTYFGNELYHHGILGQKWGIRRYQNEDGTLTEAGKKRKAKNDTYIKKKLYEYDSQTNKKMKRKQKKNMKRLEMLRHWKSICPMQQLIML